METKKSHYKVLILGAGTGGVSIAARLAKNMDPESIAIVDPAENHFYQPLWTLVGGGVKPKEASSRPMRQVIPFNVKWIRKSVVLIDPDNKTVKLHSDDTITYDYLVVATGLKLDFDKIKGLDGKIGQNGICTIYQFDDAEKTFQMIKDFKGGHAVFIMPPVPIKCAGAPQKIMYLAEEIFRKNGVREKTQITFATAGKTIFGIPAFAAPLMEVCKRKNIQLKFSYQLIEVDAQKKIAYFNHSQDSGNEVVELNYDLLHVVPPMSPHDFIKDSGLVFTEGAQTGWLKVDPSTLQHLDHPNIFGIGDVIGVPNSKTGAAIRKEAPVVVANLLSVMKNQKPLAIYDGYSSCPLITERGKVILAEFGYDGKLMPSFPLDMTKERRSMWVLKKNLLPLLYWEGMMKGRM